MQAFHKHINESFFNPIFHFIPLLLFVLVESNFGCSNALIAVYFTVVIVLLYSYLRYSNIYKYLGATNLISTLVIAFIIFYPDEYKITLLKPIFSELVLVAFFIIILILRKNITDFVSAFTPHHVAMGNNIAEHFRIVWQIVVIMLLYIVVFVLSTYVFETTLNFKAYVHKTYWSIILFSILYEFIRVSMVRFRLQQEEWWPIVNEQGKFIGSIQREESIACPENYIHPVIRVLLVNHSNVFLQKRRFDDPFSPGLWDVTLSNNIRMSETAEDCIRRTALQNYGVTDIKPVFLSKFLHKTSQSLQFVHLFIICNLEIVSTNPQNIDSVKWWTLKQIEENIGSGIFTQNFEKDFELLKRSGLLENGNFECNCHMKEVVYQIVTQK